MYLRHCVAVLAAGISTMLMAQAAVEPASFQDLSWRSIGPSRGGRVLAVAGIPGDGRHYYFGSVDGGVWATDDAGRTWRPIFDQQPVGSIGALALAPTDPDTIYVGTGEADMRSDIAHGNGMYKSTDVGRHWSHIGLDDSQQIGRVLVDPRNANVVFVAALGHAYAANAERGVFRSRDGGQHWDRVLFKNDDTGAVDLAFKPGDPATIYAALWQTRRPPWSVYPPSNGPGSGLYVSHDGGSHWRQVQGNGFPAHPGRIGIAPAPSQPDRVYAIVDAPDGGGGLYRSDDGGVHWDHVTGDQRIWQRGWYFGGITVDPQRADRVYVMNTVMLRSTDDGRHFVAVHGDPTGDDYQRLWIDPTNPSRQIMGSDQGAQVTVNGGKTWSSWYNQPTAQIYHVSTDNRFPYWVYGAQQDSGAVALPSLADSGDGITMAQFHEIVPGGENGMIAPDPEDPHIVYGGAVEKLDTRTAQTRLIDPTLAYPAAHYRSAWTLPLVFSKRDTKVLYFANQRLFQTADGGDHWQPISPDLTREDAGVPGNLDAVTAADDNHIGKRRGVIYSIAPSPLASGTLWVGTDDGLIWRTTDDGAHWQQVTPSALTPWAKVAGIELSHFDANTAYLAIDRHRLDDAVPYIYRTADAGKSWTRCDDGIPRDSFVNVVREDPVHRGLLYAGTEKGVYVSFDAGEHWQSLQQNLPMTSVRDIDVHGDDLVLATHGRGFWIMDDVTALRQMRDVYAGTATLFAPAVAIRVRARPTPFSDVPTPMPKDEPMFANPPAGAIIDYVLPDGVRGEVALNVFDAQGELVRRFSSADETTAPDPARLPYPPEWAATPTRVMTTPGMHRLVWDLHYAALLADSAAPRVWAPPGQYTVELDVAGQTLRQPLLVQADPRVQVSAAALQREFELARQVEVEMAQVATASAEARSLLRQLEAKPARGSAGLERQITALAGKAEELSGVQLHPDPRNSVGSPPQRTDSLRALSMRLGTLQRAVDAADADPNADAQASYATLSRTLQATLEGWRQLLGGDLAALNTQLVAAGHPAIVL